MEEIRVNEPCEKMDTPKPLTSFRPLVGGLEDMEPESLIMLTQESLIEFSRRNNLHDIPNTDRTRYISALRYIETLIASITNSF